MNEKLNERLSESENPTPPDLRPQIPLYRKLLFSAVVLATFLGVTEGLLALIGVQPTAVTRDPFVGFDGGVPLFVGKGDHYVTNEVKRNYFNVQQFAKEKPDDCVRVFSLGGSTTFGHPFDNRASYSHWLLQTLEVAAPSRHWEVINCGGISYASYRLARMVEELIEYRPDLFIVYTGHNEFLEARTYRKIRHRSPLVTSGIRLASNLRSFELLFSLIQSKPTQEVGAKLPPEVNTILEHNGPATYSRENLQRDQVVAHYRESLRRIVSLARQAGAQVIFVKPASNLLDFSPFSSRNEKLSSKQVRQHEALVVQAVEAIRDKDLAKARRFVEQAEEIDPLNPDALWRWAHAYLDINDETTAKELFVRARDEDVCPLRATSQIQETMAAVAEQKGVRLVDYPALLRESCKEKVGHEILGLESFLDHVHPSPSEHGLLAFALYEAMQDLDLAPQQDLTEAQISMVRERVLGGLSKFDCGMSMNTLAMTLAWAGKDEEALKISDLAMDLLPENSDVLEQRGRILQKLGRNDEAVRLFQKAVEVNPENPMALFRVAAESVQRGDYATAVPQLLEAIRLTPDGAPISTRTRMQLQLSWSLFQLGRYEEAREALRHAERLSPGSQDVRAARRDMFPRSMR